MVPVYCDVTDVMLMLTRWQPLPSGPLGIPQPGTVPIPLQIPKASMVRGIGVYYFHSETKY